MDILSANAAILNNKFIAAVAILLLTLVSGLLPFARQWRKGTHRDFPIGEALSSGVFLGAGLLHMLPDANTNFLRIGFDYPYAPLLAGMTFLVLLSLEHICRELRHHHQNNTQVITLLAITMLSTHSILAGIALGLAQGLAGSSIIFIAIIAHKWAESFSLAVEVNKQTENRLAWAALYILFTLMTPTGILFGSYIAHLNHQYYALMHPTFTALSAGTFLYIGTLHGLNQSAMIKHCCNLREFCFVIFGFGIMALVAIWA